MGRPIVLADVRLDLDDPADPAARFVIPDQVPAEDRGRDRQGRQREQAVAIERPDHGDRDGRAVQPLTTT